MDKADLIREITTRIMKEDIDSFKDKSDKTLWYATFMKVAQVVNIIEELSDEGIIDFKM